MERSDLPDDASEVARSTLDEDASRALEADACLDAHTTTRGENQSAPVAPAVPVLPTGISPTLSERLRIANLIATVLVIAIHYNTLRFLTGVDVYSPNYLLQEFVTNGLARIAVPFFAFAAGLFFFLKNRGVDGWRGGVKRRVGTLFLPYVLASTMIYVAMFALSKFSGGDALVVSVRQVLDDILLAPLSIQFWFLRDLMFLVLLSPVIGWLLRRAPVLYLAVLVGLWTFYIEPMPLLANRPLITIETLFYFSLGGFAFRHLDRVDRLLSSNDVRWPVALLILYLVLVATRVGIDPLAQLPLHSLVLHKASILLGTLLLIPLSRAFVHPTALYLSRYTFFAFLFHLYPLSNIVVWTSDQFVVDRWKFYVTFPVATVAVFLAAILCQRLLPPLYRLLTGNR